MCGVKADSSVPSRCRTGVFPHIAFPPVQLWESTVSNNDSVTLSIPKAI